MENEAVRFRSFAERYLIERAKKFVDVEEESWNTILEAKSIYNKIRQVSEGVFREEQARRQAQYEETRAQQNQQIASNNIPPYHAKRNVEI